MNKRNFLTYTICNIVFVSFCFCYLYYYQADLLSLMQYTYSDGQTHYNHLWGAVLTAFLLLSVNLLAIRRNKEFHTFSAWTFFPSAILLTFITGGRQTEDLNLSFGFIACMSLIAVCLYVIFSKCIRNFIRTNSEKINNNSFIKNLWINLLIITVQFMYVCAFSNSDRLFHARLHVLQSLCEKDYDEALSTIVKLETSDRQLTTLIVYTLSKKNMLAERLFEYPLRGGSVSLLPDSTLTSKFGFDEIYHHLNLKIPGNQIHNSIEFIRHGKGINKQAADYILCGYLMDKNLDAFVENITKYYDINDFLPKHYREALTLYVHSHTTPKVIFKNSIMDADFQDYQNMEHDITDTEERKNKLRDTYGNTYWYYYQYAIS